MTDYIQESLICHTCLLH